MTIDHEKPSFLKVLTFSILFGGMVGILCIWLFSPDGHFLACVGAGAAFGGTFGIASTFLKLSRKSHFLPAWIFAGFVGGGTWWVIAKPDVSIIVSILTGGVFAATSFWAESDLVFKRKNNYL